MACTTVSQRPYFLCSYRRFEAYEFRSIIAVHGLNGDRFRTRTKPKSKKLWLRDSLPRDLSRARILTFGYNAAAAFENSVVNVADHGRELLRSLVENREGDDVCMNLFDVFNDYLVIVLLCDAYGSAAVDVREEGVPV